MTLSAQEQAEQLWSELDSLDNDGAAARLLPLIERAARYDEIETGVEAAFAVAEEKLRQIEAALAAYDKFPIDAAGHRFASRVRQALR